MRFSLLDVSVACCSASIEWAILLCICGSTASIVFPARCATSLTASCSRHFPDSLSRRVYLSDFPDFFAFHLRFFPDPVALLFVLGRYPASRLSSTAPSMCFLVFIIMYVCYFWCFSRHPMVGGWRVSFKSKFKNPNEFFAPREVRNYLRYCQLQPRSAATLILLVPPSLCCFFRPL